MTRAVLDFYATRRDVIVVLFQLWAVGGSDDPERTLDRGRALGEKSRNITRIVGALEALEGRAVPQWLEIDKDQFEGTVKQLPVREDVTLPIEEQLIVELYSR